MIIIHYLCKNINYYIYGASIFINIFVSSFISPKIKSDIPDIIPITINRTKKPTNTARRCWIPFPREHLSVFPAIISPIALTAARSMITPITS